MDAFPKVKWGVKTIDSLCQAKIDLIMCVNGAKEHAKKKRSSCDASYNINL